MAETTETIRKLKHGLEPYIKPREQVNYIRRVLALHLGSCSGHDGPIQHPLSLADSSRNVNMSPDLHGSFREYIEALQINIRARRELDELLRSNSTESTPPSKPGPVAGVDLLEERICLLKWHRKLERLHAVRQSLDSLMEKDAASPNFLDPKQIFQGMPNLPDIADELVGGSAVEDTSAQPDLTNRLQQMERIVLRARLKLKQEERALFDSRARCKAKNDVVSNSARLEALKATRDELIGWIEAELGKAPSDHVDKTHGIGSASRSHFSEDEPSLSARLDEISHKYAKYVSLRKTLLELAAPKSQTALLPPAHFPPSLTTDKPPPAPMPVNFLLTPYLSNLIAESAKQKAMAAQRTFINSALGKESQDSYEMLGHLVEESHLLPAYPSTNSLRRRSGIQHEMGMRSPEQPDIAERIKPWVFAADSAKIATLESVAETVEGGQVALENCMSLLQDIDVLLGRDDDPDDETSAAEEPSEDDGWYGPRPRKPGAAKPKEKKLGNLQEENDVWSKLDGTLGLLG